jgi:hypothetical protein
MACTRFNYDDCRTKKQLKQSTDPGRWILNVPGNGSNPCYIEDPQIIIQKWGANLQSKSFNVEEELRGATRKLGSDYQLYNKKPIDSYANTYSNGTFYIDESRASCPAWLFRDVTQHRPQILDKNPQYNVFLNFENNQATRILEKDYYLK